MLNILYTKFTVHNFVFISFSLVLLLASLCSFAGRSNLLLGIKVQVWHSMVLKDSMVSHYKACEMNS